MKLKQAVDCLALQPFFLSGDCEEIGIAAAFCGDLMSDVLANVPPGAMWFTIQNHVNIVAVAQLRDVACIVLVNGVAPDPRTLDKARDQGINLCGSKKTSAELCMQLAGRLSIGNAAMDADGGYQPGELDTALVPGGTGRHPEGSPHSVYRTERAT